MAIRTVCDASVDLIVKPCSLVNMSGEELLIGLVFGIIVGIIVTYYLTRSSVRRTVEAEVTKWKALEEGSIRKAALDQSRFTIKGKVGEQLAPLMPLFKYNLSDARFIRSPIDYLIFDGYTSAKDKPDDSPITIVLMDVKTGETANLTPGENMIKQAVERGRVRWETLHINLKD